MSRRLVVDGQLFQTPAWYRGMGKYSLELLAGILAAGGPRSWDSVEILMSSKLRHQEEVISSLGNRLKGVKIQMLDLVPNEIGNPDIVDRNRQAVDAYISNTAQAEGGTDYLILSIMQGEIAPAFPSDKKIKKMLLFYDLIPLMFFEIYLKNPITRVEYLSKLQELFKADLYFAISKTVANDLALYLGVDRRRIVSIDGGPIDHAEKAAPYPVAEPFILMPTGNDLRKNNKRAIMGFEQFNQTHNNAYSLVITSFFKNHEIVELSQLSDKVIFTGNVSGEELSYLYDKAEALLFPPEYEGLGLPILEAMERRKPVACSDISVFREMSRTAFHYFNPYSIIEIKNALEEIADDPSVDEHSYIEILDKYIWSRTVDKMIGAEEPLEETVTAPLRLAVFGADPSHDNRTGKLMQSSHAELVRRHKIDYYCEAGKLNKEVRINYLPYVANQTVAESGFDFKPQNYDLVVYHIANEPDLSASLLAALAVPGVVVLHDLVLDKLWQAAFEDGLIHESRLLFEQKINHTTGFKSTKYLTSLIANQRGVVVFNDRDKTMVQKLAAKINKRILIGVAGLPVNGLIYSDTLPDKIVQTRYVPEDADNQLLSDFQYFEELSRTLTVATTAPAGYQPVLEAMAMGAVPIVPATAPFTELSDGAVIKFKQVELVQSLAEDLNRNEANRLKYSMQAMAAIERMHNQRQFVNSLSEVALRVFKKGRSDG